METHLLMWIFHCTVFIVSPSAIISPIGGKRAFAFYTDLAVSMVEADMTQNATRLGFYLVEVVIEKPF